MLVHYDLFAGIGGFSLAIDEVFKDESILHIFSEWEPFPAAVLQRHWPNGLYYGNIAELAADLAADTTRAGQRRQSVRAHDQLCARQRQQQLRSVLLQDAPSILTGGFPCQPFSAAGRRRGTADDRYKWPDMFAVIRQVQPTWVVAENVPGLATWQHGVVFERVCADLESEGYAVQPLLIPACAVNAPHRRERLWILAHQTPQIAQSPWITQASHPATYAAGFGGQVWDDRLRPPQSVPKPPQFERRREHVHERVIEHPWNRDWQAAAAELCGVDDGLPVELDGRVLSAARYRQEQLKAYGNAIVPQVAIMIMRAIQHAGFTRGEQAGAAS